MREVGRNGEGMRIRSEEREEEVEFGERNEQGDRYVYGRILRVP
jgi:hypothetical protein